MKNIILISLCFKIVVGTSATISLITHDSIINPLMFSNNFGKKIYGKSALFTSNQKKFIIGIFDSNGNDTLDKLDVLSISELRNKATTLFLSADKMNSNYIGKLKFIIIGSNSYRISKLSMNDISIDRTDDDIEIKEYNFIDCLTRISQFNSILIDSTASKIDTSRLNFSNGKPTIIYYTALRCAPCEKLKPLINELLDSKDMNLIIVSNNLDNSNKDFRAYKNRYYFNGNTDPSKVRNYGFPQIIVFDKEGKFIESDNGLRHEQLLRKYALFD